MKNVFFALAFMLVGSFVFATTNLESKVNMNSRNATEFDINVTSSMVSTENLDNETTTLDSEIGVRIELFAAAYYCSVEDGHLQGVGYGNSSAQACRRARRVLRRAQRAAREFT